MSEATTEWCDAIRREVDPRFDYGSDSFGPPPGTWAPDCGHAACVEDDRACTQPGGFHDWDCPVAVCRMDTAGDHCDRAAGHAGEHDWRLPAVAPLPGFEHMDGGGL